MPTNDYEKDLKRAKGRVKDYDISDTNKETILKFDKYLELNDYSEARRYKYLIRLPKMGEKLDVSFEEAEKDDIEDIILWIKRRDDISERTKSDYKILLKRFYRWIGDGEYPDCVDWLEVNNNQGNDKLPEEMLTEDDIEELIKNAMNPRDDVLIAILWETGARIGELIDLTVSSIENREHGLKIVVDGKTGSRRIPLIESVPYLNKWLEEHPNRENKDAPLWVNIGEVNEGKKMQYASIRKTLQDVRERSDIDKPVNPHNFRHSRATYLATRFTEAQMCEWFGWVQGSDVPSRYTHLSGRDIDADYDRLHGIEDEENTKESKLIPDDCPRCGETVPKEASFCHRCGQALNPQAWEKVEEGEELVDEKSSEIEEEVALKFLKALREDDEVMKIVKKVLEKKS